jgi:very-short-patch-repair endonuclease
LRGEVGEALAETGEGDMNKNRLHLFAQKLRLSQADAEKVVWSVLRNQQLGYKFRRQHKIGNYIVDFVCLEEKQIIELDGGQHTAEKDKDRTAFLQQEGFRILRLWNNDVLENKAGVIQRITQELNCSPSPERN